MALYILPRNGFGMAPEVRTLDETDEQIEHDGFLLHVYQDADDGQWCVWLNTEVSPFDGIVIGLGATRDEAYASAIAALEGLVERLQNPPLRS